MTSIANLDSCLDVIERGTSEEALTEAVTYIATEGCTVNDIGSFGYTILIRACEKNHLEVIELCFENQVEYDHQTIHQETAFNSAARHGSVAVLRLLVQRSKLAASSTASLSALDIRSRNKDGCTPFYQAVQSGDLKKVHYMATELDVDYEESDNTAVTPLHVAVKRGDIRMVEYLHALGCTIHSVTSSGASPIFSAVSHKMYTKGITYQNNLALTKLLLSYGASSNVRTSRGWTLLSGAVEREDIPLVEFLLTLPDCGLNEAADGKTPLFRAVEKGNLPLVQLLVRHGADADLQNTIQHISPLLKACDKVDTKMAQYLVHVGAEMPQLARIRNAALRARLQPLAENRKYFPIQTFLRRNDGQHERLVDTIRTFRGDICRIDGNCQTPFMVAAERYKTTKTEELRKVLIEILSHVCRSVVTLFVGGPRCRSQLANSIFVKPSSNISFPSFRYYSKREFVMNAYSSDAAATGADVPGAALLYFEVMVLTEGLVQIGVASPDWTPISSKDGVGDDNKSIAFDGCRKCCFVCGQQVALEPAVLDTMPLWQAGAVVGVVVSGRKGKRGVTFFLNNIRMTAMISLEPLFPDAPSGDAVQRTENSDKKTDVSLCSAVCTLSRGSAVRCNFGETDFTFVPDTQGLVVVSDEGVMPWNSGSSGKRRRERNSDLEYYQPASQNSAKWIPVDNQKTVEFAVESSQDMFDFVASDSNAELLDAVLSSAAAEHADLNILCNQIQDAIGRTMIDLASFSCRKVLQSHLFFFQRYEFLTPNRSEHISDTSMVMLCRDHNTDEDDDDGKDIEHKRFDGGAKAVVALKMMKNKEEFHKEVSTRLNCTLSGMFVVQIVNSFDGDAEAGVAAELDQKGFGNYKYCIVMQAAERSLERILAQENIAGKNWPQIKYIFTQIVNCVSHMHSHNLLHADLKPLNIMRTGLGNMCLIDLDASIDMGGGRGHVHLEQKCSSAFCPPEWAAMVLQQQTTASLDNNTPTATATAVAIPLVAKDTFDLWALGVILFHMVSGEPLFLSNQADCIDVTSLQVLCEWGDSHKLIKLQKIKNPQAQNLVSRLLNKDATRRPSLSAVLLHPFLSGRPATRLVGDPADFDVFISYRVASDSKHAEILYDKLTTLGLRVWFDKKSLLAGKNWEEGFCDGLVSSRAFVCLLSKGAIAHPANKRQNLSQLSPTSNCDNVLLEHQLALEMRAMGMLDSVFPVFIGEEEPNNSTTGPVIPVYEPFDFVALGNMPTFSIPSVDKKLRGHLDRQCLGAPLCPQRSVQDTLAMVTSCQGGFITGEGPKAFDTVAYSIHNMCQLGSLSLVAPPLLSPPQSHSLLQSQSQAQPHQSQSPTLPLSPFLPVPAPAHGMTQHIQELHLKVQDMLTQQNKSAVEIDEFVCDFIKNLNIL